MTTVFRWNGDQVLARVRHGRLNALRSGAEFLLGKANETVPHDEGTLEQSGATDVDMEAGEASVYYGGAASAYAVVQHERLDFHHRGKGRAKWLELTLHEQRKTIQDLMAAKIREALE